MGLCPKSEIKIFQKFSGVFILYEKQYIKNNRWGSITYYPILPNL